MKTGMYHKIISQLRKLFAHRFLLYRKSRILRTTFVYSSICLLNYNIILAYINNIWYIGKNNLAY
jgi:hypothetical protein